MIDNDVAIGARLLAALLVLGPTTALAGTPLLREAGDAAPVEQAADPTISRARTVRVNPNALHARELELALFDGVRFTAIRDRAETVYGDGFIWEGHIDGQRDSYVVLSVVDDALTGNITTVDGQQYQLRYVGQGFHSVREMNLAAFPDEAPPIEVKTSEKDPGIVYPLADTGSTIDVMVVYTAAARSAAGGTTAMLSLINTAVSETNSSYSKSGINQRVRLVHTAEVTYTETGDISTDLGRLRSTTDGYMDNVHTLRNTYKADLVSLFVANGGSYCGIAYIMTSVSTSFAPNGFNVVDKDCATGYYSFGHEMGHNMGARHDRYVDNTDYSPYKYNHGYYYSPGKWRTVMAYNNGCSAVGVSCTRIPHWSNPNVFYNGVATGVSSTATNAADNRLTLNNTAYTVANFRASQ